MEQKLELTKLNQYLEAEPIVIGRHQIQPIANIAGRALLN